MHKKPSAREIATCLPWLEKEIEAPQRLLPDRPHAGAGGSGSTARQ